ncbi:MAG: tRNA lysidine(34) synthetase TilS [Pseudomonadales bacterium]|nr:tRNA lysidine(34) synthetase TilS [Pseudomonadales bacterium]
MVATLVEQVRQSLHQLKGFSSTEENPFSLLVGYSGGVDSQVLLHICAELRSTIPGLTVRAIHIHHGLSENADQWKNHCQQSCDGLNIPLVTEKVQVEKQKGGIEAAARTLRHNQFRQHLKPNEVLVLAHHQDDQAETVLYRLMRGAGVKGLSGMESTKGPLFKTDMESKLEAKPDSSESMSVIRPFLFSPKKHIISYAEDNALHWVEDESNEDVHFSRNFLRHKILPELEQHWPHAVKSITRASRHCREADELCGELAKQDAKQCDGEEGRLQIQELRLLSDVRQRNLLRFRIQELALPMPSEAVMFNIQQALLHSDDTAQPLVSWGNVEARRYQGELYFIKSLPPFENNVAVPWDAKSSIRWEPLQKTIAICSASQGLRQDYQGQLLVLRVRQGGERCRPYGRAAGSQTLKKLFQEYSVQPWLRDRWPLLYCDDTLIALPGLFVCAHAADRQPHMALSLI